MSEIGMFDKDNIIQLEQVMREKYPVVEGLNFHSYFNKEFDDFIESKVLQAWLTFKHYRNNNSVSFDKRVKSSIKKFQGKIFDEDSLNGDDSLRKLLFRLYWVLIEYSIWNDSNFSDFINESVFNKIEDLLPNNGSYSFRGMKERVFNNMVYDFLNEGKLKEVYDLVEKNNEIISDLKKKNLFVNKLEKHVGALKKELDRIEPEYQGRLLTKSFFLMLNGVNKRLFWSKAKYNLLTFISVIIPILVICFHVYVSTLPSENILHKINLNNENFDFGYFLSYVVPFLSLEIMLFYFVRLSYRDMNMLNAQRLQVEHRLAVSRFIRSYARQKTGFFEKYINDTCKDEINNNGDLGKFIGYPDGFENLIFSPIQADAENIPSALDSVNSIAELVGKVMSAKK